MFWRNRNIVTKSLKFYDFMVNDINCRYAWRCHKKNIFENYRNNIKTHHLEIGPGTGYFLKYNSNIKKLYLMDINNDTLNFTKKNMLEYCNNITTINHNIFENRYHINNINSIGINYELHCVPGKLENNIDKLVTNLNSNNKLSFFGATVLNDNNLQTYLSKTELKLLNNYGIFNNSEDYSYNLINYFQYNNFDYKFNIIGNVIIFSFSK